MVAAAFAGFSKTGIPGAGMLFVAVFANLLPARQATGAGLPLLIFADAFAYFVYRRNLEWRRAGHLLPWALAGLVLGRFFLGHVDDHQAAHIVGLIITIMLVVHLWRKFRTPERAIGRAPIWFVPVVGFLTGFATMVANASGPVLTIYLLVLQLPKLEFLGTTTALFLIINWVKVPFGIQLGFINVQSLLFNLNLLPAVAVGALVGPWVVKRIDQGMFESCALLLAAFATIRLLFA